jgi:hypothetical protein
MTRELALWLGGASFLAGLVVGWKCADQITQLVETLR